MKNKSIKDTFFLKLIDELRKIDRFKVYGKIKAFKSTTIEAYLPAARKGDIAWILTENGKTPAEVVGFSDEIAFLIPLDRILNIAAGDNVEVSRTPLKIKVGDELIGKILDGYGKPVDGSRLPEPMQEVEIYSKPSNPINRLKITGPMPLGIKAIDGLLTVGEGQRIGIFAGSGVGKSTLIGQIAKNCAADVVVIGLIGERGREVREFIEDILGDSGLERSIVIFSTSDSPPVARLKACLSATTIAEWFREKGKRVVLLVDSITRLARALREIGLAAGEPPARRGYPPSVFDTLPEILERAGNSHNGTMTAIYSILVEGSDMDEPVADEVRGILDGHIVLDRQIAERGIFPAINILQSISRVMDRVVSKDHLMAARWMKSIIATYEQNRELIQIGAYRKGSDQEIDRAIALIGKIEKFISQDKNTKARFEETETALINMWKTFHKDYS